MLVKDNSEIKTIYYGIKLLCEMCIRDSLTSMWYDYCFLNYIKLNKNKIEDLKN